MSANMFQFETGVKSHVGRVRSVNEDSILVSEDTGIWLVADGMGGHRNGQFASSLVVDLARNVGKPVSAPDLLARFNDHILRANNQLLALSNGDGQTIVGTTVAALLTFGQQFACVWAGDSRVYLLRVGAISRLSKDHTEVQELLDSGVLTPEEAQTWPRRNVITRAIGTGEDPGLDIIQGQLQDGDTFVLCSDGLTGHVSEREILLEASRSSAQAATDALVALALERGGKDNVSVIVLHVRQGTAVVQDPS